MTTETAPVNDDLEFDVNPLSVELVPMPEMSELLDSSLELLVDFIGSASFSLQVQQAADRETSAPFQMGYQLMEIKFEEELSDEDVADFKQEYARGVTLRGVINAFLEALSRSVEEAVEEAEEDEMAPDDEAVVCARGDQPRIDHDDCMEGHYTPEAELVDWAHVAGDMLYEVLDESEFVHDLQHAVSGFATAAFEDGYNQVGMLVTPPGTAEQQARYRNEYVLGASVREMLDDAICQLDRLIGRVMTCADPTEDEDDDIDPPLGVVVGEG